METNLPTSICQGLCRQDAVLQFFSRLGSSADVLRQLDALLQVGVVGVGVGADGQARLTMAGDIWILRDLRGFNRV